MLTNYKFNVSDLEGFYNKLYFQRDGTEREINLVNISYLAGKISIAVTLETKDKFQAPLILGRGRYASLFLKFTGTV